MTRLGNNAGLQLLLSLFIGGCYPKPLAEYPDHHVDFREASIVSVEKNCEDDQWTFLVETDAWTGNGFIVMASEERSERHPLYSFSATEDGNSDTLKTTLTVIPNWQNFSAGSSTGWLCTDMEALYIALSVQHVQGTSITDCVYWGENIWGEEIQEEISVPVDCRLWE